VTETTAAPSPRIAVPGADTEPLVSIIIVTHGTGPIVLDTLEAVVSNTSVPYEVIVVDNEPPAGRARTANLLAAETSGIRLVCGDRNLGFAGGNNLGVEHARASTVCFLNPDVIVSPGWLPPLVAALDDPVVGIAVPVLVNTDGSLQEAGQLLYDDGCTAAVGGPEVCPGDWSQAFTRDVDYASAACWVVRRDEFLALGGFDERYHPAYFEDVDYALRVEASGKRTRLVADVAVVHHHGHGSPVGGLAIAEASQGAFRTVWASRLAQQPSRPRTDAESISNRDRLAAGSVGWFAPAVRSTLVERCEALETARRAALDRPRDRLIFATDDPSGLDLGGSRSDGVDVVVGPVDQTVSARASTTTWHTVGSRTGDHRRLSRDGWMAMLLVVVAALGGIVIRWLLLDSPAAIINADEAYTRIDTYEILRGQFPMVLGGTVYTLPLESYLYTPFTYVFGANVVPLKLLSTLSWVGTSVVVFFIGRRLVGTRAGVIAAIMCWITPGALLILSITAYPAYASGMLVVALAFLVGSIVVDAGEPTRRSMLLFGALAGFGFWLHPMFLTVLIPMTVVVLWTVRRRLDGWLSVIAGGILGCLPFLLWNAVNGWPSLEMPVQVPGTYTERLRTFAVDLLPRAFGLRDGALSWHDEVVGPILYLAVISTAIFGLVTIVRRPMPRSRFLLLTVLLTVFPMMALLRNLIFANDGRYAMISFPFVLIALAGGVDALAGRRPPVRTVGVLALVAIIWVASFIRPTAAPYLDALGTDPNAQLGEIVDVLDGAGITRVYGSYWGVLPVDFAGDNRIVGAVFPFWPIRFPDRQRIVGATPPEDVAVIYMSDDEDPSQLLMPADRYERIEIGNRVVYLPLPPTG
jgi:GT2 family glycosyltransferase/4-amino-4-deoxy-L-arabinose transferase-like glycosyltransferase